MVAAVAFTITGSFIAYRWVTPKIERPTPVVENHDVAPESNASVDLSAMRKELARLESEIRVYTAVTRKLRLARRKASARRRRATARAELDPLDSIKLQLEQTAGAMLNRAASENPEKQRELYGSLVQLFPKTMAAQRAKNHLHELTEKGMP